MFVLDWSFDAAQYKWDENPGLVVGFKVDGKLVSVLYDGKQITTFDLRTLNVFRGSEDDKDRVRALYPFVSMKLDQGNEFAFQS